MSDSALAEVRRLLEVGLTEDAARLCEAILNGHPANFHALYLSGFLHFQARRYEQAADRIGEASRVNPRSLDAGYQFGCALQKLGRHEEALAAFNRVLAINPAVAEAWSNCGKTLLDLKRYAEAVASLDRALTLGLAAAEIWSNRGSALLALGRAGEAVASFDRALALNPESGAISFNRGNALVEAGQFSDAIAAYDKALSSDPAIPYARGNRAFARLQCCDWTGLEEERARIIADVMDGKRVAQPGSFIALSDSPEAQLRCAEIWIGDGADMPNVPLWKGEGYRHGRIKLGYVSADFRAHPVGVLIAGVLAEHDRDRFETIAISLGADDGSEVRKRISSVVDRFTDVRDKTDAEIAALLKQMEVDIAIDLMGFTQGCRPGIFGLRPAPVQVNYLGYPGTTGTRAMDYLIADAIVVPPEHHAYYSENIVTLPDTFFAGHCGPLAVRPGRAQAGLPESGLVFCAFNNHYKILPPVFAAWMRILKAVEGGVLWLARTHETARLNLLREAESFGVAAERLIFAPFVASRAEHLARLNLADIFLDTQPYNAHATANDALAAGLPVLTCASGGFAGRVAAGLVGAAGLPDLIAADLADYEALALRFAREPAALAAVKARLARNRATCPLFDTVRFTRHLEAAFAEMSARARRGEPAASFAVKPISPAGASA